MNTSFWWIFDALAVAIAAYVVFSNARRGFTKVMVASIGYVISVLLASILAFASSNALYESVARPTDLTAIEAINSKINFVKVFADAIEAEEVGANVNSDKIKAVLEDPERVKNFAMEFRKLVGNENLSSNASRFEKDMRDAFIKVYSEQLAERMPRYVQMNFAKQAENNPNLAGEMLETIFSRSISSQDKTALIEDQFAKEPTKEVLQIFVYLIVFCLLMVFAALISAALEYKIIFGFSKRTDHALGALVGVVEAIALLAFFTIAVRLVVQLGGGTLLCFNNPTIEASKVFSFFYDHINLLL